MSVIVNEVRRATYFDSMVLMRISRQIAGLPGVEEAGLFIGTPANKNILREAGILGPDGDKAESGDLILAVRASDNVAGEAALVEARRLLDQPLTPGPSSSRVGSPRTIRTAVHAMPNANLALISVPGPFAAAEARKALRCGLHVMIFSNNVAIEEEAALKCEARDLGLLVMGPDCGTSIIAGLPLGFANVVRRGDIGIIGASGTGIQEVSCLIARAGGGISHAIGTGGRDLEAQIGAITTLMAIDALDADEETEHVVLISKSPAASVGNLVVDRVAKSSKSFTICFLGAQDFALPANARSAPTLKAAAEICLGRSLSVDQIRPPPMRSDQGKLVRGLFVGGTLCAEAQIVFRQAHLSVASNMPVPGAAPLRATKGGHVMMDLGHDEFTRGRPHPMIEPAMRDGALTEAIRDPQVGVILLDIILGYGAHRDPAGHVAGILAGRDGGQLVIASVVGTDGDPQTRTDQVRTLAEAGVIVAASGADAAEMAIRAQHKRPMTLHVQGAHSRARRHLRPPMPGGGEFNLPILRSGILARAFCRRAPVAEVAAVFDGSLHLRAGDMFICIGKPDIGNGPLTLIADNTSFRLSDLGVNPGQSALVSQRRITIGDAVQFTLDRCELWRAPHWPTPLSPDRLTGAAKALARLAMIEAPQEGLARQMHCSRVARRRIASFEHWLSDALKANDAAEGTLPNPVQDLIGLGCGLTPSGDDFLVGALALLDALAERRAFETLACGLTRASPTLTSPLSHCFLRAAAAGYVGENLYQAVSSVIAGRVDSAVTALRKIGHSSGWDMLTGIAITLKIFATARLEP